MEMVAMAQQGSAFFAVPNDLARCYVWTDKAGTDGSIQLLKPIVLRIETIALIDFAHALSRGMAEGVAEAARQLGRVKPH